ncbi:undecaprenyl-diphosphate phosphatase [Dermatophilus congolensis]|uniref:undecaprenyl-diphosphate phosphatase n=1 Tax=Dermatophilus congolensis TaxID=1863 RepID=UPI001AAF8548|nr:undecaprenyl-diphosphate phosphatase [Dermatophilus congolensis]MBO3152713.1 undecaprenyl-diphosphate phosphatase [Dermatophilus congolensis]MBO3160277.1 undecaprenyl-diphosphate phosphatase [Dermatophilus congolensis]MBO3163997.1 undecaprenyl-diphosphate phosphatase [Dermatophilus congolensis]MBO3177543.1 undecaprenyl-diphosphate phosphatase [Dermatophilus congolensis]
MNWLHAIILGIVEGVTEFLPVSSTGHLTVAEKLLGYEIDSVGMTAFTAVIQLGAILAAIIYFWGDIVRIAMAWLHGLTYPDDRDDPDYRLGWGIILGSIPVAVVGLLFKSLIETTLRSMWVVAAALLVWSIVMWLADRHTEGRRNMEDVTITDALVIGGFQALSPLFAGISRSGATMSAGLFRGFDRVTATRLSFFMGIPALVAAGVLEGISAASDISTTVGWGPTIIATIASFVVGYASIAWLLKFVASNTFSSFIVYRVLLGLALIGLLAAGIITA